MFSTVFEVSLMRKYAGMKIFKDNVKNESAIMG